MFKRCKACSRGVDGRRCPRCGSDRLSWAFQVDVQEPGEARRQVQRSGFATRGEAEAAKRSLQARAASGEPEPTRMTLGEWLDQWTASRRGDVRGGTWATYELIARAYVKPRIGDAPLRTLTRARLKAFYAELGESGGVRGGRPLSAKTVHNVALMLRKALADAVEDRIIPANPAERSHRLPAGRREMAVWDGAQVAAFLGVVRADRLHALWRLAFATGMRRGEMLGLRWRDVDLGAGALSVQQQRVRGADGLGYGAPKTAKGRRRIALDAETVAALRVHRARQAEERLAAGPAWRDEGLVFARADGSPLDPDVVSQSFERLSARAALPRIRLHDARHTHGTLLLAAGVHPKVVQERLGHSSIQVTMDVYSHVLPGLQEDAAERARAGDRRVGRSESSVLTPEKQAVLLRHWILPVS